MKLHSALDHYTKVGKTIFALVDNTGRTLLTGSADQVRPHLKEGLYLYCQG